MTKCDKAKRARRGFTLTEVMVTLALFSIFVPAILMMQSTITRLSQSGVNRNLAMSEARFLQQHFIRKINASSRNIRIQDDGDKVLLEMYSESSGSWEDGALCYLPERTQIVYFPPGATTSDSIANHVHRNGTRPVFSAEKDGVRCDLFIGKTPPEKKKVARWFVTPGVFVDLIATPRNAGKGGA